MQAVIADTEREIAQVQEKINQLLREDVDRRTFVSVCQRISLDSTHS